MGVGGIGCIVALCLLGLRVGLCYLLRFKVALVLWVLVHSVDLPVGWYVGLVFCGLFRLRCDFSYLLIYCLCMWVL